MKKKIIDFIERILFRFLRTRAAVDVGELNGDFSATVFFKVLPISKTIVVVDFDYQVKDQPKLCTKPNCNCGQVGDTLGISGKLPIVDNKKVSKLLVAKGSKAV